MTHYYIILALREDENSIKITFYKIQQFLLDF